MIGKGTQRTIPLDLLGAIAGALAAAGNAPKILEAVCALIRQDDHTAWQPIETAPSDVPVLLYSPCLHFSNPERIEARVYHDSRAGSRHAWATHWMPLPIPPTKEPTP